MSAALQLYLWGDGVDRKQTKRQCADIIDLMTRRIKSRDPVEAKHVEASQDIIFDSAYPIKCRSCGSHHQYTEWREEEEPNTTRLEWYCTRCNTTKGPAVMSPAEYRTILERYKDAHDYGDDDPSGEIEGEIEGEV